MNVYDKRKRLNDILVHEGAFQGAVTKFIIFCKTKKGCDALSWELDGMGFKSAAIHGDKDQRERDYALAKFKRTDGSCNMLVATDVAARGLDIKSVEVVVNYDFPMQVEDYVHRIGRCGRAGAYGRSYAFFNPADVKDVGRAATELVKILEEASQNVPDELRSVAQSGGRGFGGGKSRGGGGKGGGKFGGGVRKGGGKYGGKY